MQNFAQYHQTLCETFDCNDVSLMTVTEIPASMVEELPELNQWMETAGGLPYQIIERVRMQTLIDSGTVALDCYLSADECAPSVLLIDEK